MANYSDYIEIIPEKNFGRAGIKGTRISVCDVLNRLASGMSIQEITSGYPELSEKQIKACLFYAGSRELTPGLEQHSN